MIIFLNIIVGILIIHILGNLLTKNNHVLACGLFGWVGSDVKEFNRDKLNILGIANESRGTHSCGISTDGNLYKGTYSNKSNEFNKLLMYEPYPSPNEIPVVIGHTRFATGGTKTAEFAHPFKFVSEDSKDFFIGAHNGTLKNESELAKKYGIDATNKIDSQILLEILSNDRPEVLLEYRGAAALLMYSSDDPKTMWVFRGESKEYQSYRHTKEERPLFFYQESDTSMYLSSLEEPLQVIASGDEKRKDKIFSFRTNVLYKIVEGKITSRTTIDRSEMTQGAWTGASTTNTGTAQKGASCGTGDTSKNQREEGSEAAKGISPTKSLTVEKTSDNEAYKNMNIHYDKYISTDIDQDVYYEMLRYKTNGEHVTGICLFMDEIGFVPICKNPEDVKATLSNFTYTEPSSQQVIDFGDIYGLVKLYYIYDGALLKTAMDYSACISHLSNNGKKTVELYKLLKMSQYPLINNDRTADGYVVYKSAQVTRQPGDNNNLFQGALQALGSYKTYTFVFGNLESSVIHNDFFAPDPKEMTISADTDGKFVDFDGDIQYADVNEDEYDDSEIFEENLEKEFSNFSASSISRIARIKNDMDDHLKNTVLELDQFDETSMILDNLNEFTTDTQNRFKPISDSIDKVIKDIQKKERHGVEH